MERVTMKHRISQLDSETIRLINSIYRAIKGAPERKLRLSDLVYALTTAGDHTPEYDQIYDALEHLTLYERTVREYWSRLDPIYTIPDPEYDYTHRFRGFSEDLYNSLLVREVA